MSTWVLSSIYTSEEDFDADIKKVKDLLEQKGMLKDVILNLQEAGKILQELDSYIQCLMAQNTADQDAQVKNGLLSGLLAKNEAALFDLGVGLSKLDKEDFDKLAQEVKEISFFVAELRDWAKMKGPTEQEGIINALAADGYHSFWALYQSFTGKMRIKEMSVGQVYNLLSDADRNVRIKAFENWTEAWKENSDVIAQILNHLAGFRLSTYEARGWDNVLTEPLMMNRMEESTLNAMFSAINEAKPMFIKYLEKKAEILGLEKLSWVDVEAPLGKNAKVSWDDACSQIVKAFEKFHPKKAEFAKRVIDSHWIDAEDRAGKAAGGFCVQFPKSNESRIFMTYTGTPVNVATLAHELGHAYHNLCVEHLPYFHQQMQMNVAETASTFGEMVVIDQAIEEAISDEEKIILLDDKLQRAIAYFMNLSSRLSFEKAFYAERKKGFVSAERLCELMVAAQREAFGDSLSSWSPYFWASKLHFYYTHCPFYNFPYTFGYLLSNGLYARAKKEDFGEKFDAFLADTAQMNVEDLAEKHLGVDLRKAQFWRESVGLIVKDIEEFVSLRVS